ncbi:Poly(ADP-ribose) polymerase pme-1 [Symbiodinium microadriaticum]|uniref:NAD(+) ADP-ribosyltransferase n=1 Tax=Symbiodinium microadriaticum TaxID=2951 RepID=A0A1Q9EKW3_SYMMI|nr:Poly(ADP-ribose) polymerase pme-1 [Symbiodinium microadriaticum]
MEGPGIRCCTFENPFRCHDPVDSFIIADEEDIVEDSVKFVVQSLLFASADANERDGRGNSPLRQLGPAFIENLLCSFVKFLWKHSSAPQYSELVAVDGRMTFATNALLSAKASATAVDRSWAKASTASAGQDDKGRSAAGQQQVLSIAILDNNKEVVDELLSAKADPSHQDKKGLTPMALASRQGSGRMAQVTVSAPTLAAPTTAMPDVDADARQSYSYAFVTWVFYQRELEKVEGYWKVWAKATQDPPAASLLASVSEDDRLKVDLKRDEMRFYHLLIHETNKDLFVLFTRWGEIGARFFATLTGDQETGAFQRTPAANKEVFKEKTGNVWDPTGETFEKSEDESSLPTGSLGSISSCAVAEQLRAPRLTKHCTQAAEPQRSQLPRMVWRTLDAICDPQHIMQVDAVNAFGTTREIREAIAELKATGRAGHAKHRGFGFAKAEEVLEASKKRNEGRERILELSSRPLACYYELIPRGAGTVEAVAEGIGCSALKDGYGVSEEALVPSGRSDFGVHGNFAFGGLSMSISVEVRLLSGKAVTVEAGLEEDVAALTRRAQAVLGVGKGRLLDSRGTVLDGCVSIKNASLQNGDSLALHVGRVQVGGSRHFFAAILGDARAVTWGNTVYGGDSRAVKDQLKNVQQIQVSGSSFATILGDGSVVAWGSAAHGGDCTAVRDRLKTVQQIQATECAFAAILDDGAVVTWGHARSGGDSSTIRDQLKDVRTIQASLHAFAAILGDGSVEQLQNVQAIQASGSGHAFAAILGDGSVVAWGFWRHGGDSSSVQDRLKTVQQIQATECAFAAILDDGSVVTWGDARRGGDSSVVQDQLKTVQRIQRCEGAFAAILGDGTAVAWGDVLAGGDSQSVRDQLKTVQQIQASMRAFAAILENGSVVTWGDGDYGGDSTAAQDQLKNVQQIQASSAAFAAILDDGTVVTWGDARSGGDSSAVRDQLRTVQAIQASRRAFAAVLDDGSVVTWGDSGSGGDSCAVQDELVYWECKRSSVIGVLLLVARPIESDDALSKEFEFDLMPDIFHALVGIQTLLAAQHHAKEMNPMDYCQRAIGVAFEQVKADTDEFKLLMDIVEEFGKKRPNRAIQRPGESPTHVARIPKIQLRRHFDPGAAGGTAGGKGIYFADMFAKSRGYTAAGSGEAAYMLLCDVALGNHNPGWTNSIYEPGGAQLPKGSKDGGSGCLGHNEFIVYDPAQVRMRYLIELNNFESPSEKLAREKAEAEARGEAHPVKRLKPPTPPPQSESEDDDDEEEDSDCS